MLVASTTDSWVGLSPEPFDVGRVYDWAVQPGCGAVVMFSGTVRDHADGRTDVQALTYEAYEEQAMSRMAHVVDQLRDRWPTVGRVALLHRVGRLELGESSVLAVVSAPHRPEAFEATRFAIDTLKTSVPIWKHEEWEGGSGWGTDATPLPSPAEHTRVDA